MCVVPGRLTQQHPALRLCRCALGATVLLRPKTTRKFQWPGSTAVRRSSCVGIRHVRLIQQVSIPSERIAGKRNTPRPAGPAQQSPIDRRSGNPHARELLYFAGRQPFGSQLAQVRFAERVADPARLAGVNKYNSLLSRPSGSVGFELA